MNKVERINHFLIGEVGMKQHKALSRIPISVVFEWILLFAQKNHHLRVTQTWYDPSDEWNTLCGVCEDCLPHKDANLTVSEAPVLGMCFNCNEMKDYDTGVAGESYGQLFEHPVKPAEVIRLIDQQWRSGHGIMQTILESEEWAEMQTIKSSARKALCVLVDEEYGYRTHLWWPDMDTPAEVTAWYKRQGWIHTETLREWGRLETIENNYNDLLDTMLLPKMHVHMEEDQYFHIPHL
jgi:hypothetical protein